MQADAGKTEVRATKEEATPSSLLRWWWWWWSLFKQEALQEKEAKNKELKEQLQVRWRWGLPLSVGAAASGCKADELHASPS